MKFVIVGLGSIGKRHQKNLTALGYKVIECHRDDNLKKLLDKNKPDGVLICNPTSLHAPTAMIVANAGYPIFLEKPISHNLKGVDELIQLIKQKNLVFMMGYCLRFEPKLNKIRQRLVNNELGKIYSTRIVSGGYYPNWRPGVNYKKVYGARKDLGGGVLLDLSHEIDYAVWLFGRVKKVFGIIKHAPKLEIETEALVQMNLEFETGIIAQIQVDYLSQQYRRKMEIMAEKETINWDFNKLKEKGWDINEMYIKAVKYFIKTINGQVSPFPTIDEGKHVLEICEAIKESNKTGKIIKI